MMIDDKIPTRKINLEDYAGKIRTLANENYFFTVFDELNKNPELLKQFTIGELSQYCEKGKGNYATDEQISALKKNIEVVLYGEKELNSSHLEIL